MRNLLLVSDKNEVKENIFKFLICQCFFNSPIDTLYFSPIFLGKYSLLLMRFVDKVVAENEGERNIYAIGDY